MAKILVVDDEPDIIRMAARLMEECGHQVITAKNGVQALELIREEPPDLVVVDMDLPQLNGLEVCKSIKRAEASKHIPIIMMTAAYVSLAHAKRATGVGANAYVLKPFMGEILVMSVERLLAALP